MADAGITKSIVFSWPGIGLWLASTRMIFTLCGSGGKLAISTVLLSLASAHHHGIVDDDVHVPDTRRLSTGAGTCGTIGASALAIGFTSLIALREWCGLQSVDNPSLAE